MSQDILTLAGRLDDAERAFARVSAQPFGDGSRPAVIRDVPGCERACPRCTIRCAVVAGAVQDLRTEYGAALGVHGAGFVHAGTRYPVMAGRA